MYLVINFKENLDFKEYQIYVQKLLAYFETNTINLNLILCPAYPFLEFFNNSFKAIDRIYIGAQDVSANIKGSHTGEVSATHLAGLVSYCIVNHSETLDSSDILGSGLKDQISNLKKVGIKPIVCLKKFDSTVFSLNLSEGELLAYEDPEHIGGGGPSSTVAIQEFCDSFEAKYSILYGGSVSADNIVSLGKLDCISGFLIGSYTVEVDNLINILNILKI